MAADVNTPDLSEILTKWRWLVPADVDIRIRYDDLDDNESKQYRAQCLPDTRNNRLLIKVAPHEGPVDQWGFEIERDVEADVVHELIHWRFDLFTPDSDTAEYETWEAAVERTAQDYIRLDRQADAFADRLKLYMGTPQPDSIEVDQ